jgi:hypothetical protein
MQSDFLTAYSQALFETIGIYSLEFVRLEELSLRRQSPASFRGVAEGGRAQNPVSKGLCSWVPSCLASLRPPE